MAKLTTANQTREVLMATTLAESGVCQPCLGGLPNGSGRCLRTARFVWTDLLDYTPIGIAWLAVTFCMNLRTCIRIRSPRGVLKAFT